MDVCLSGARSVHIEIESWVRFIEVLNADVDAFVSSASAIDGALVNSYFIDVRYNYLLIFI